MAKTQVGNFKKTIMSKIFFTFLISVLLVSNIRSQTIVVGTFNLRYDNPRDTGNLWKDRAPVAASLIRFHDFDVLGTQEGLENQLEDLEKQLPEYERYGVGRDDGKTKGEHSAIFFKKDKFEKMESGDFWLSENSDKPGPGWDAKLNRICSWVKLKDKKSKKVFYVFNVHYDHQGVEARRQSSQLLLRKIPAIAGKTPVMLTGDFNGNRESEWYTAISTSGVMKDALSLADKPYINNGSFNSFRTNNPSNDIIDHIFMTGQFRVDRYGILTDTYHGKFPSDHYPVLVALTFTR